MGNDVIILTEILNQFRKESELVGREKKSDIKFRKGYTAGLNRCGKIVLDMFKPENRE